MTKQKYVCWTQPELIVQGSCLVDLQPAHIYNDAISKIGGVTEKPSKNTEVEETVIPKLMDRLPDELTGVQHTTTRQLLHEYEDHSPKTNST